MNGTIFGIGPMELLMIAVLILLIFGPERVPSLMRDLGRTVRKLRQYYVAFSTELKREMEPFQEDIKDIQDAAKGLQEDLYAIRQAADIRGIISPEDLEPAKTAAQTIAPPAGAAAAATVAPTNGTASVAVAGSAPVASAAAASGAAAAVAAPDAAVAQATVAEAVAVAAPVSSVAPVPVSVSRPASAPTVHHNGFFEVELSDDNPWAQAAYEPRTDKLDDDNPWAS
jgi:sec-independent protein translocase protein TatB